MTSDLGNFRPWIGLVMAVACWVGCGTASVDPVVPDAAAVGASEMSVTFHLPGMCERLHLL